MAEQQQQQPKQQNVMQAFKLEKVTLNIGGVEEKLNRGVILLERISGKKAVKVKATKRIPTWSVRPGLEVGCKVTLRGKDAEAMLKRLLPALDNTLKEKQIQDNFLSFGIHEYIEIPGMEYIREVGVLGFEVTAVFGRPGKHVISKKVKRGRRPKRLRVAKEDIIEYLETTFKTRILRGKKYHDSK